MQAGEVRRMKIVPRVNSLVWFRLCCSRDSKLVIGFFGKLVIEMAFGKHASVGIKKMVQTAKTEELL